MEIVEFSEKNFTNITKQLETIKIRRKSVLTRSWKKRRRVLFRAHAGREELSAKKHRETLHLRDAWAKMAAGQMSRVL